MHILCHILRGMKHAIGSFFALFGVFSLVHQASEAAFHRSNCKRRSTSRKWRNRGWVTSQKSASTSRKATNSKYVLRASKFNFCGANEAKNHIGTNLSAVHLSVRPSAMLCFCWRHLLFSEHWFLNLCCYFLRRTASV